MTKRIEARQSLIRFTEYTYQKYRAAKFHERISDELNAVLRGEVDRLMIKMPPRHGKALAFDTPVPTPYGWATIGGLRVGDEVFDDRGIPCRVVAKSAVWKNRPVYNVETDDGDIIVADAEHEWLVRLCRKHQAFHRKTTRFLAERSSARAPMIAAQGPLNLPHAALPIDPYVLGVWLGDGRTNSSAICSADHDLIDAVTSIEGERNNYASRGVTQHFRIGPHYRSGCGAQKTLQARLRSLGVLGHKHVPDAYKRASYDQRLSCLQGLVDTDGHVAPDGQVEFCSTLLTLAQDVRELVASLGHKASIIEGRATLNGVDHGPKYRVMFYMAGAARLPRKAARCRHGARAHRRYISVTPGGYADTVCIEVDSPSHMFLCGRSMLPTHNSELGSKRFPAFAIGHRPDLQLISASATAALAEDFGRDVRNLIASQEYQSLFPGVELAPDSQAKHKWHTNKGGIYYSLGIGGSIMGRGADIALIDDVFASWEDAQSAVWLDKVWSWYTGSLYNRLMSKGAIVLIGHRGNERDLQGRLLAQQVAGGDQWRVVEFKAIDDDGRALWPERYPIETLERIKKNTSAPEWNALFQQDPSTDDEAILKSSWWNCWPAEKRMPEIVFLMQVWDTAFELHEAADYTACTVWGVFFNTDTGRYEIMLLGRYQERVDFPELRKKAKEYYLAYHQSSIGPVNKVIVEAKATGKPIVQELRRAGIPVNEFEVIRNSRGKEVAKPVKVQAASVVLSSGSVWYPEGAQWADSVITECRQFRANMTHEHDDLVDTCLRGDTGIICKRGVVPIADVAVGDLVLTHRGRWRKVTAKGARHSDHLILMKGKTLSEIGITEEHPMYVERIDAPQRKRKESDARMEPRGVAWKPAGFVRPRGYTTFMRAGKKVRQPRRVIHDALTIPILRQEHPIDVIDLSAFCRKTDVRIDDATICGVASRSRPVKRFVNLTRDVGWLLGLYLAEGCWSDGRLCATWSCDRRRLEKAERIILEGFGRSVSWSATTGAERIVLSTSILAPFFAGFGKLAENKRIPEWAYDAPPEFRMGMVEGISEGDGSTDKYGRTRVESTSLSLLWGARVLLTSLGIQSSIISGKKPGYRLVCNGASASECLETNILCYGSSLNGAKTGVWSDDVVGYWVESAERISGVFTVYNLAVEEDESYVTTGGTVHNCAMAWVYLRRTWWLQHEDDRDRGEREQIRLLPPRGAARTDDNIWDDDDDDEEAA